MLKAREIMTSEVVTVGPGTPVTEVAELLLRTHFNGVPVVDEDGELIGIVCRTDIIAEQKKLPLPSFFTILDTPIPLYSREKAEDEMRKIAAVTAADAMTPDPVTVSPGTGLDEIATIMVNKHFHTLPVMEGGKLVGIIGKEDILRTIVPGGNP
jgi:CBS domain-containing protein